MKFQVTEVSDRYGADSPVTQKSRKAKDGSRVCPGIEPSIRSSRVPQGRVPLGFFATL